MPNDIASNEYFQALRIQEFFQALGTIETIADWLQEYEVSNEARQRMSERIRDSAAIFRKNAPQLKLPMPQGYNQ